MTVIKVVTQVCMSGTLCVFLDYLNVCVVNYIHQRQTFKYHSDFNIVLNNQIKCV